MGGQGSAMMAGRFQQLDSRSQGQFNEPEVIPGLVELLQDISSLSASLEGIHFPPEGGSTLA